MPNASPTQNGRPHTVSTRSPASPSPPPYYSYHASPSAPAPQPQRSTSDDLFSPTGDGSGSASYLAVQTAHKDLPSPPVSQADRPNPSRMQESFTSSTLSPSTISFGQSASDGSSSRSPLSSAFGAQLRKGSDGAPWEEDNRQSVVRSDDGESEAGWAALGLSVVDRVERRGSGQPTPRSPPTSVYLRPVSRVEQFGQVRSPQNASLAAAMYAFPTEGDDQGRIPSYYSPIARSNGRIHSLPSPSPSPEQDAASTTPTKSYATRPRQCATEISTSESLASVASNGSSSSTGTVLNARGAAQVRTQRKQSLGTMSLDQELRSHTQPPPPVAPARMQPVVLQQQPKVIKQKKSLLKMFSKSLAHSSASAPPVPATPVFPSTAQMPSSSTSHYQKASTARNPSPEPSMDQSYSFVAPMTQMSVRGCDASDFEHSPSPSEISLSVEAPSRASSPSPDPYRYVPSSTTDAFIATLGVKPLKLRPISQAWTTGMPVDFLSLPPSPQPSSFLSPGSVHSSLPSPSASSFASGWSDASSTGASDFSNSFSIPSEASEDKDFVIRRLERQLKDAKKGWQIERFEYQSQIRDLKATLAEFESQGRTLPPNTPSSPTGTTKTLPPAPAVDGLPTPPRESAVDREEEKISIMDRARVKTGGGRATFGRGDLRL